MTTENIAELQALVADIKQNMLSGEVCASQLNELSQALVAKLNENSEVLYNQSNTATNLVKSDMETLNTNLKEGVKHLEKIIQSNAGASEGFNLQTLSEDILLLSKNIQKSNDNLKRSVIDIFSKIQEQMGPASVANAATGGSVNVDALVQNLEMLKNGLYNVNLNSTQQYGKVLQAISELDAFKKLEQFAQLKSLPAVGQFKDELYKKVSELVVNLSGEDFSEPNTVAEKLTENVYNEFVNVLDNATENVGHVKNEIESKLDVLLPYTRESMTDVKCMLAELKSKITCLQSGEEDEDYAYSMQDIESDVAKIRIYLNELGQHINQLVKNNATDEINNIYITLDAINQKVSKNEKFEITDNIQKMQEDVLSISTRVNTLLLSSDKDSEELKNSLQAFNQFFQEINNELKSEAKLQQYENLENSLDRINRLLEENRNYNELINQSLIMLAEWVDTAGESISNISEKLGDGIDSIKIPETVDYSGKIVALESKIAEQNAQIAEQQLYIKAMDEKLALLLAQNQKFAQQEERIKLLDDKLTTVLEFSAKNDSSMVMDKMISIDTKLEKLGNSIGKLTSYVDEE